MRVHGAIALLVVSIAACASAQAAHLDYLHIEANVGTSSGGHAAIRIDDQVYHYRNVAGGVLRLARQDFDAFRYVYTVAENRSIQVGRISVSDGTHDRVRDHFDRRYLIEQEHFSALVSQRDDVALLERILGAATGEPVSGSASSVPQLRGAGFFDWSDADQREPAVEALRDAVAAEYGDEAVSARIRALDAELAALRPVRETEAEPEREPLQIEPPSRDRMPIQPLTFSERFVELATARMAFAALERAPRLVSGGLRGEDALDWRLAAKERAALRAYAVVLERRIVALVGSQPAGFGEAVLIGMARLIAIRESLLADRWVVLDAFARDSQRISGVADPARAEFLDELHRDTRRVSFEARRDWALAERVGEREYNAVEAAANRYLEVRAGIATGREIRVQSGHLVPHGEYTAPDETLPKLTVEAVRAALLTARARASATAGSLDAIYGYELFTRNCVSAIFDTLEGALPPDEVAERLGGRVAVRNTLNFIPRVSFGAVQGSYRVSDTGEIPSLRRTEMAAMYARENPAKVYFRESNTLTSTVYRDSPHDGFFVFFTDDSVWTRPIYGAINFVAGLGQAVVGLLRSPFVGPRDFVAGAEGALFSLPELFFVNFRKGSLDYGPSEAARTRLELEAAAN